jgi:hypothetical protein
MRDVPASITEAFTTGISVGDSRPIARVTVQRPKMKLRNYSMMSTFSYKYDPSHVGDIGYINGFDPTKGMKVNNSYADFQFTNNTRNSHGDPVQPVMELPNVKSVSWQRSIDSDIAECTIEVWNTRPLDIGETPRDDELDHPGYYTYSRGASQFSPRWGQVKNEWFGMLMPDNIIRTYEGYGHSGSSTPPELDPHLVQTGVWLIDSVTMSADQTMSIKCRDIGRILMDQYWMYPVVNDDFCLQDYINWDGKVVIGKTTPNPNRLKVTPTHSSNEPWIGLRAVHGHPLSHAFDGDPNTYWLSIGNIAPSRRFAFEWVECAVNNQTVSQVKIRTKKKGYVAYVSLKVGGVWQGIQTIDYHPDMIGMNHGDIPYVISAPVTTEGLMTIDFPDTKKVQAVRITLGNLQNFHFGPYPYRGGIRDVQVFGVASKSHLIKRGFKKGPAGSNPGRYDDYTEIIKLICGWAGFLWPTGGGQLDCNGNLHHISPSKTDGATLGRPVKAAIWGDFQDTGTSGPNPMDYSNFDKKTLLDCMVFIRDTVGFLFFIDEVGGIQWRFPNIYNVGNWRTTISSKPGRTNTIVELNENTNLVSLEAVIDVANVREAIYVGTGTTGTPDTPTAGAGTYTGIGAYAPGWNPNPTGLRRVSIWSDVNFASIEECQQMADMIALAQLFTFRTDRVRIKGYPAIQIDDQVRINERTTAEGYLHYVKGISSSLDMSTGEYTYDLDTHWLGYDPESKWIFDRNDFHPVTKAYLESLDKQYSSPFLGPSRLGYIHSPLPGE